MGRIIIKEVMLYHKLEDKKVLCGICGHRCTISPGERGFCKERENRDGTLYTLDPEDSGSMSNQSDES